ncbi:MAG: NAD(P) transhydrogenase subunit alpha, partial [Flavobacteriaceae bacterium]|nr:NAD(P) transhydrogenase subunit alpha [Flavobacteriaceae bacterium]
MKKPSLGVIGTSRKEDEKRVPIHPDHLSRLPEEIRKQLIFEKGYGAPFGVADDYFVSHAGGVASRHELLADIGAVIIAKPVLADLQEIREGGFIWGYPHCAQQ